MNPSPESDKLFIGEMTRPRTASIHDGTVGWNEPEGKKDKSIPQALMNL